MINHNKIKIGGITYQAVLEAMLKKTKTGILIAGSPGTNKFDFLDTLTDNQYTYTIKANEVLDTKTSKRPYGWYRKFEKTNKRKDMKKRNQW